MLVEMHEEDGNGNVYRLQEPFGLLVAWNERTIHVPYGFESDGASVPRFFWRAVFPPGDTRAMRAAFAHDYIYRTHPEGWTRADADRMFYDTLVADGMPRFRAWRAYMGVRLFGGWAWRTRGGLVSDD